jgi:hypothetical protein
MKILMYLAQGQQLSMRFGLHRRIMYTQCAFIQSKNIESNLDTDDVRSQI